MQDSKGALNVSMTAECHTLEDLVFSLQCFKMIQGLLIGVLQFKELSAQGSGLLLGALQLTLRLFILLLPLRQDLMWRAHNFVINPWTWFCNGDRTVQTSTICVVIDE